MIVYSRYKLDFHEIKVYYPLGYITT